MRQILAFAFVLTLCLLGGRQAMAACPVPNTLTNGTTADATQVMANFNSIAGCATDADNITSGSLAAAQMSSNLSAALDSAFGSTQGSILYRGASAWSALTPGATGTCLQSNGVSVNPSWASCASSGSSTPLFNLAAGVPAATAFTALNLSSGTTLTDQSPKALYMQAGSSVNNSLSVEYKSCPATPYRIAILAQSMWVGSNNWVFFGWRDGSSGMLQILGVSNGSIWVQGYNSPTSYNSQQASGAVPQGLIWVGLRDDGTNIYYEFSEDGVNFTTFYSVAKSSGFLGTGGYNTCLFGVFDNNGSSLHTALTVRVWDENGLSRSFP